jgi:hypothetical protein
MRKLIVGMLVAVLVLVLVPLGVLAKPDMDKPCRPLVLSWYRRSRFVANRAALAEVSRSSRQPRVFWGHQARERSTPS